MFNFLPEGFCDDSSPHSVLSSQKLHNAANANQKEKYEADLKKEIKKLQVGNTKVHCSKKESPVRWSEVKT